MAWDLSEYTLHGHFSGTLHCRTSLRSKSTLRRKARHDQDHDTNPGPYHWQPRRHFEIAGIIDGTETVIILDPLDHNGSIECTKRLTAGR